MRQRTERSGKPKARQWWKNTWRWWKTWSSVAQNIFELNLLEEKSFSNSKSQFPVWNFVAKCFCSCQRHVWATESNNEVTGKLDVILDCHSRTLTGVDTRFRTLIWESAKVGICGSLCLHHDMFWRMRQPLCPFPGMVPSPPIDAIDIRLCMICLY